MLRLIRKVAKDVGIDNIQDATIVSNNLNGTYNIRLRSGAIKRNAVNMAQVDFKIGDVVNISMVGGNKETAKIVGRSMMKKGLQKIVYV